MSAAALLTTDLTGRQPALTEVEALRKISQISASATEGEAAVNSIAVTALRVLGSLRIRIAGRGAEPGSAIDQSWGPVRVPQPHGTAIADIVSRGIHHGELRLDFDLRNFQTESPLRFAKFIAQQIAGVLHRAALVHQAELLKCKVELVRTITAKRKAIRRATAIVAKSFGLNEAEAFASMCRQAREFGWSLHQIAEAHILENAECSRQQYMKARPEKPADRSVAIRTPARGQAGSYGAGKR